MKTELPPVLSGVGYSYPEEAGDEYLASIYGTEKDKVNCSFYYKIGACRHGDRCSRVHNRPKSSHTILIKNVYHNPVIDMRQADACSRVEQANKQEQEYFDEFYEELFTEINDCYGRIRDMKVCENIGEHMIGNVYVKFFREDDAQKAVEGLEDRWFNGEAIYAELSPVVDFREASCRQFEMGGCNKGAFCNFMHLKQISHDLDTRLYGYRNSSRYSDRRRSRSRERNDRGDRRSTRSPRHRNHGRDGDSSYRRYARSPRRRSPR